MSSSTRAPEAHRAIARHLASVFGGEPDVRRHWNDDRSRYVAVLEAPDRPQPGVTSWGTIGLSDWPLVRADGTQARTRLELVGACASAYPELEEALLRAASTISSRGRLPDPGTVLLDAVVLRADEPTEMRHGFLVPPFLWPSDDRLAARRLHDRAVAWLQLVPISTAEQAYAEREGASALDDLLEREQVDVFDLRRASSL